MNANKNSRISSFLPVARRTVAALALCTLVAATATWLTSSPAEAGKSPGVTAMQARAPSSGPRPVRVAEAGGPALTVKGKTLRGKLNINTATEEQFTMLPGIGPSKARRILENRTKRGKFRRVRDLRRVKGIGYKTLKKLEPYLTITGATTLQLQ